MATGSSDTVPRSDGGLLNHPGSFNEPLAAPANTCHICGKNFVNKYVLTNHLLVHTGQKPFKCEECGKKFGEKGTLKRHKLTVHTGQKNFKCEECGRCFGRKSNLTRHMRIHAGVNEFVRDTGGTSGKYGTINTGGGSEDFMTDQNETTIKEEPIAVDIETVEEQTTIKEEPIAVDIKTEEEEMTIKEEPIYQDEWM